MKYPSPSQRKDVAEMRVHLSSLAPDLDLDDELLGVNGPLGTPLDLGFRTVGNRFVIHPMEGWDGTEAGSPSEFTLRRWRRFGASGAKWIWGGEAFAVNAEGRANPNQLCRRNDDTTRADLRALRFALEDEHRRAFGDVSNLAIGLQLTHSGRYSRPTKDRPRPRIAVRHPLLDARVGITGAPTDALLRDDELEAIADDFVHTAKLAAEVGFHFVDVKCCHGYLLHEILGARERPGRYGGSLFDRARYVLGILDRIRDACPKLGLGVRLSVGDTVPYRRDDDGHGVPLQRSGPYPHGFGVDAEDPTRFDLDEPMHFIRMLAEHGVTLLNVTLGSPYVNPHLQRPATYPPSDGYLPPGDPLRYVAEHLRVTRHVKRAFPRLAVVGTGYTYLQEYLPNVAQHEVRNGFVDAVGLGRMVLSYPELPRDVLAGRPLDRKKLCRTFSDCTTAPRNGLRSGCYPLDPFYRAQPESKTLRELKKS